MFFGEFFKDNAKFHGKIEIPLGPPINPSMKTAVRRCLNICIGLRYILKQQPGTPTNQGILNSCKKSWKEKFQIPKNTAIIHPCHLKPRSHGSPRPIAQSAYHQVTQSNPHKTGTTKLSYLIRRESFRSLKNFKPKEFFLECKKCKILLNVQSFAVTLRTFYFYIPNLLKPGFESTFDLFESIVFENFNRLCIFTAH